MTGWHNGSMTGFDLETTSPDPLTARIVTAAVVQSVPGEPIFERLWLADPGVDIPEEATAVHGVTTAQARENGRPVAEVVAEIVAALADLPHALVIYNAPYDLTVLDREARRRGLEPLGLPELVVDPLVLDKHIGPYRRGSRKLTAVAAHYGTSLDEAHTAGADALAAMRVAWKIGHRQPLIGGMSAADLMSLQARARAKQARSLEAYFARIGNPQPVTGHWPIQPYDPDRENLAELERT